MINGRTTVLPADYLRTLCSVAGGWIECRSTIYVSICLFADLYGRNRMFGDGSAMGRIPLPGSVDGLAWCREPSAPRSGGRTTAAVRMQGAGLAVLDAVVSWRRSLMAVVVLGVPPAVKGGSDEGLRHPHKQFDGLVAGSWAMSVVHTEASDPNSGISAAARQSRAAGGTSAGRPSSSALIHRWWLVRPRRGCSSVLARGGAWCSARSRGRRPRLRGPRGRRLGHRARRAAGPVGVAERVVSQRHSRGRHHRVIAGEVAIGGCP